MCSSAVKFWSARRVTLVTLLGMVMEVSADAPLKAVSSIDVTLLGMVMEVSEVAPKNVERAMVPNELGDVNVTDSSANAL